jgi:hypothetical protein
MVCDEVKVYTAYCIAQIIFGFAVFGKEIGMRSFLKLSGILMSLGWITLIYLLCERNYRRLTWWFVAITVGFGVIGDIAILASPSFKNAIKKGLDQAASK